MNVAINKFYGGIVYQMQEFTRFFENIQQDLKAFIYWCLVFTLFRITFIAIYSGQLNGDYSDLPMALLLGLRLSLKTAGVIALVGFVIATLPKTLFKNWFADKIRICWHTIALVLFSICFMARIPYYKIFNAAFNMMLVNGAHDDIYAIFMTAVKEYQLVWRLPLAIVMGIVLAYALHVFLNKIAVKSFADVKYKKLVMACTLPFIVVLWIFVRYGGAFNYAHSINWESAARLKSNLLNEAILDDGQAIYRVRETMKKIAKVNNINITVAELRQKIAVSGGNENVATIDKAFLRTVKQPKLVQQPSNVVLVVGESFGNWPFLPKFQQLGLVNNMLALQNSAESAHIATMLPHGSGTIAAVNGLVTGLPDTGLYENYQPMTFKNQYQTGIAYIMKQLGYKTVFWYGGFSGWQNIGKFIPAQSFDEFHCADEFNDKSGNAWGCEDAVLLKKVAEYMQKEPSNEKVFHVVLTTSNHPPYSINVDALGFPREQIKSKLTADIAKDEKTLTELGHIWYADKTMGDFVKTAQKIAPDSLFVITGDHSERFSFATEQDARTISSIPCIFYGKGVQHNWFSDKTVGDHMQLAGTLAEILAPAGFEYSALQPSMFDATNAFNHRLYAKDGEISEQAKSKDKVLIDYINSMRGVSAWRVLKGDEVK